MIEMLDHREPVTAEQIWRLQHAAYRAEAETIGFAALPPLMETIADIRRLAETFYGIRDEDGELVAALSLESEDDGTTVTICRVMVHPNRFRQGLARRLLVHAEREHPAAERIRVTAATANVPAVRLYASLGYAPVNAFSPAPGLSMTEYVKRLKGGG